MNNHDNSLISDEFASNEQFAHDAGLETYESKRERQYPSNADMIACDDWSNLDGFEKKILNSSVCSNLQYRINKNVVRLEQLMNDDRPDPKGYRTKQTSDLVSTLFVLKGMRDDAAAQFVAIYHEEWDAYKDGVKDSGISGTSEAEQVRQAAQAALAMFK